MGDIQTALCRLHYISLLSQSEAHMSSQRLFDEVFEIMGFPTTFLPWGNFKSHLQVAFFYQFEIA
ncbi:MAG: hypothetical protein CO105_15125 [Comamonadaceae bacterium CG_4_9_14_3_um_filter_60_33]|nr:MAG: hypothetical protein AUK51_09185 [Comamonadaceae bacterium CG2_30_59_20]PIY27863.1 MAG: hypothetical protein COZ09_12930 [Comamonadaceae bacterium CG_4_10_14_3_um_filter_60_42]PJB40883.1 MAG: hypothetical protein CO105_15125 [Comamonadaceae bacterium CG_4_9_14_3_um_filter_60_33]